MPVQSAQCLFSRLKSTRCSHSTMENRVDELADDLFLSIPAQDLIDDISQDAYLQALVLLPEQGISHNPIEISGGGVVPGETFRYS